MASGVDAPDAGGVLLVPTGPAPASAASTTSDRAKARSSDGVRGLPVTPGAAASERQTASSCRPAEVSGGGGAGNVQPAKPAATRNAPSR